MTNEDLRNAIHLDKVSIPAEPLPPTILIDTREKKPYTFNKYPTAMQSLPTGDYSIRGYDKDISVERKSLRDLYGCMTKELQRFYDQMERLAEIKCRLLMVEGTWEDIGNGKDIHPKSTVTGSKVHKVLFNVMSWGVPVFFACDRRHAQAMTTQYLLKSYSNLWKWHRKKFLHLP